MQIIGKFKLNNIIYGIGIKDNKYHVGKLINNQLITDIDINEINIINYILKELTPTKNIITVTPVTVNDNQYQVYFDYVKKIFLFQGNDINDLAYLNAKFNNQNEYVNNTNNDHNNNYFKRLVKIGKKTVLVFLSSAFMLSNVSAYIDNNKLINIVESNVYDVSSDFIDNDYIYEIKEPTYSYNSNELVSLNRLKDTINSNNNLTQEEKEIIYNNLNIIIDNSEYIDFSFIVNKLRSLKIEYINQSDFHETWNIGIAGKYLTEDNIIKIYNTSSFKDVDETVFVHELYHVFQQQHDNSFFIEGLNSMCVDEYFHQDPSYKDRKDVIKYLSLVLGNDVMRELNFNYSDKLLIDNLKSIIPDELTAYSFLSLTYEFSTVNYESEDSKKIANELNSYISKYYEAKYNRSSSNDLLALMYSNPSEFVKIVGESRNIPDSYNGSISWIDEPSIIKRNSSFNNYTANLLYEDTIVSTYEAIDKDEAIVLGYIKNNQLDSKCFINKTNGKIMIPVYDNKRVSITRINS